MQNETFIANLSQSKFGDPNFDSMRPNKTKISLPSERSRQIVDFYTAVKMMECFRYRQWMSHKNVIGPNGERINPEGQVYMPKFKRKM